MVPPEASHRGLILCSPDEAQKHRDHHSCSKEELKGPEIPERSEERVSEEKVTMSDRRAREQGRNKAENMAEGTPRCA